MPAGLPHKQAAEIVEVHFRPGAAFGHRLARDHLNAPVTTRVGMPGVGVDGLDEPGAPHGPSPYEVF